MLSEKNPNSQKMESFGTQMDHSKDNLLLPLFANCELECMSGMHIVSTSMYCAKYTHRRYDLHNTLLAFT